MLAGVVALAGAGLVGYFLLTTKAPSQTTAAPETPAPPPAPGAMAREVGELGTGEGMRVQFTDEDDPSIVTGELRSASIEPLEARRYVVMKPEMWFYQQDGSSLLVRAATGRLYMPSQSKEPESGRLEGGVVVKLFPARADGSRVTEETGDDAVSLVAGTAWLEFDMALGEMSTTEILTVEGDQLDFRGKDIRARFDEVTRSLVLLEVREGGEIVYDPTVGAGAGSLFGKKETPAKPAPKQDVEARAPRRAPDAQEPAPATQVAAPVELLYHAAFAEEVVLSQPGRAIEADDLDVWARTVENKLPDGAIRRIETARLERRPVGEPIAMGRTGVLGQVLSLAYAAAQGEDKDQVATDDSLSQLVTLSWSGVLRVTPIDDAPVLRQDDLAFRFSSERAGGVRFSDEESKGAGEATALAYQATTSQATVEGSADVPAWVLSDEFGRASFERADADLANGLVQLAGVVDVSGAGDRGRISCSDGADVALHMEDGKLTGLLREAIFNGDVVASDGESRATGATARGQFEVGMGEGAARSRLSHFHVEGSESAPARLEQGESKYIEGEVIDVALVPGPGEGEVDPSRVEVVGSMRGRQDDSMLTAGRMTAELSRDDDGNLVATSAEAHDQVHFVNAAEDLEATADEMQSSPNEERVTFMGASSMVRRGTASVFGEQISLDGQRGRIGVFGEGHFDDQAGTGASASWTREMMFDDQAGRLECHGDVEARVQKDADTLDTIKGLRLIANIAPREAGMKAEIEPLGESMDQLMGDRAIIGGMVIGSIEEEEDGLPAIVQSIRYATVAGEDGTPVRQPVQAMLLEGARIELGEGGRRLDVPDAGRLVVVDERARREGESAEGGLEGARGQAMFTWLGAFSLDRDAGEAEMLRGVKGTLREPEFSRVTLLDAERVVARFGEEAGAGQPSLTGATAEGAVYLSQKTGGVSTFEVIADGLEMDNVAKTAEAVAAPGNVVTVFDGESPTPATAKRFFFDLAKGRWEVRGPGMVTSPK